MIISSANKLFYFFLSSLHAFSCLIAGLGLPVVYGISVKAGSLALFLTLEEMFSVFHYWVLCSLWTFHIWILLCEGIFYFQFVNFFNMKCSILLNAFSFPTHQDYHVCFFPLHSVDVIYYLHFSMLSHPYIPGINSTWVFLRIFIPIFIRDIGL